VQEAVRRALEAAQLPRAAAPPSRGNTSSGALHEPTGPSRRGNTASGVSHRSGASPVNRAADLAGQAEGHSGRANTSSGASGQAVGEGSAATGSGASQSTARALLPVTRYYAPARYIDQADLNLSAQIGAGPDYARCFHCGMYKHLECQARKPEECVVACVFCKTKEHNGRVSNS
jgi:hypothetical protein